ncbi:MAG TPA: BON domain-containing protein [Chloroflexota bacterium]|nr:BON domain-containing protein [Chloroflexota bacterium]
MADEVRLPNEGREPNPQRPENPRVFAVGDNIPTQGQIQPRSDTDIKSDCESALFYDTAVSSLDVHCDSHAGIVTLTGTVDSDLKKRLAAEDAWKVPGVKDVKNEIQVNEATIPSRAAGQNQVEAKPPLGIMGEPTGKGQQPHEQNPIAGQPATEGMGQQQRQPGQQQMRGNRGNL